MPIENNNKNDLVKWAIREENGYARTLLSD